LALVASVPDQQSYDFWPTLEGAAKAGLAAEALKAARMQSDPVTRDLALGSIAVPLADQGQLDDAFAAAADIRVDSSDAFVQLFALLSEKDPRH
jgi:hypothetical protein